VRRATCSRYRLFGFRPILVPKVTRELEQIARHSKPPTCGRLDAIGRGSGVPVTTPIWTVIEFRGGRMSRAGVFHDRGEALRAAGLAE
jgi:hypothetical protein